MVREIAVAKYVGATLRGRPKDGTINGARPMAGRSPFRVTK